MDHRSGRFAYRVLRSDPTGRWQAGEVGYRVVVDNPFKYDVWLDFGDQVLPPGAELFGKPISNIRRVFGFYQNEVERLTD